MTLCGAAGAEQFEGSRDLERQKTVNTTMKTSCKRLLFHCTDPKRHTSRCHESGERDMHNAVLLDSPQEGTVAATVGAAAAAAVAATFPVQSQQLQR